MRHVISLLALLFVVGHSQGQVLKPVTWSFSIEHVDGDAYDLKFKAEIDPGWAIYSQHIEDGGPIPTSFAFEDGPYSLEGDVVESDNAKESHDPFFDMKLVKFFKEAEFTQRVKMKKPGRVKGYLEFMTCDDEKCLPPTEVDFAFDVEAPKSDQTGIAGNPGVLDPVKWTFKVNKLEPGYMALNATAHIEEGWYVYSQHIEDGGPIPTTFYFDDSEGVEYVDTPQETGANRFEGFDAIFQMDVVKYQKEVTFSQKIKVADEGFQVTGELEFMACDDEKCLSPKFVAFKYAENGELPTALIADGSAEFRAIDQSIESIRETYQDPVGGCSEDDQDEDKSLFLTFGLGFIGGLLALLTPCVFPMIPLTVSYFSKDTKKSGWTNGLIYGLSIVVIYVALGLIITLSFGATALNALSTNWIANTLFFVIFIAFAFSFFGYYEITLPSSWTSKSDRMADKGGLIGTFFMAFTLALVSFSCTGPIIGSAIVQSATDPVGPFVVMLGFSTALALPFGLFAAFPAWLNTLPKSGSWMNSVKVMLGFLELALAFKFLSVADMTSHWGFLRYELFLGIWVVIAIAMALYLMGFIRFPHDSPNRQRSVTSVALATAMAALAIYLATGFAFSERTQTYDALPLLSGIAPPAHYNFFKPVPKPNPEIKARFASFSKCANNLDCFKDYYEGVAYAQEVNKPVFLDFTGYGCVNCRKTEEHIWVNDNVWARLKNDYVMISLYVDDRKPLDEVLYSSVQQTKMRNVGSYWADFQVANFEQNSQPLYVIISPDERVLTNPRGYREGVKEYAEFLDCGLTTFREDAGAIGQLIK